MTNIKVFGLQDSWMDSPPARYMNTTDSIHPYLTHMDQTAAVVEGRRSTDKQVKLYTNQIKNVYKYRNILIKAFFHTTLFQRHWEFLFEGTQRLPPKSISSLVDYSPSSPYSQSAVRLEAIQMCSLMVSSSHGNMQNIALGQTACTTTTSCHPEIASADNTFYLTQTHYTDTNFLSLPVTFC